MRDTFEDRANFVYVYIKEAHPEDEWQAPINVRQGVVFRQPRTFEERLKLAQTFVDKMQVTTPTLVDSMDNKANVCYAALPERIYVIQTDGRVVFKSGVGPQGFKTDELREFLEQEL